jgi:hypothetical protein
MFDATIFVQTLSDAMQTDMSARPFPELDSAVEKFMAASRKLQEVSKLKLSMQRHYNFVALRRDVDAARRDIDMAFAMEMLPKIMCGGTWCQIRATARMPDHSA